MAQNITKVSKRIIEVESTEDSRNKIQKTFPGTQLSSLPDEMIAEIFSNFNEVEDMQNSMLVCKRFRDLSLKSPDIMRNFLIKLPEYRISQETFEFLKIYGVNIKNIDLEMDYAVPILKKTPNIEELSFNTSLLDLYPYESDENVQLSRLRSLFISGAVYYFLSCLRDVRKVESLMICFDDDKNGESLTDFVIQQRNLKHFRFICTQYYESKKIFPTRDISRECPFKLTQFIYDCDAHNENMLKFLEHQLKTLTELIFSSDLNFEILDVIFSNGQNLQSLTLNTSFTALVTFLFSPNYPQWVIPNIKFFSTIEISAVEFTQIFRRFPKVASLSFKTLNNVISGTHPQLETFHIGYLDLKLLQNLKLPNLKNLIFHNISNLEFLKQFIDNVPNIENIAFNSENEQNLDFLKQFTKLQKLEYRIGRPGYFKILVDYSKKTVYRNRDGLNNLEIIQNNFPDFEIIEDKEALSRSLFLTHYVL